MITHTPLFTDHDQISPCRNPQRTHATGRKATSTIKAVNRMAILAHADTSGAAKMREEVNKYKEESEKVRWLPIDRSTPFPPPLLLRTRACSNLLLTLTNPLSLSGKPRGMLRQARPLTCGGG